MNSRLRWGYWHGLTLALLTWVATPALAQPGLIPFRLSMSSPQFELAETVQLDRADGAVLANLERVKAGLADRQWDEAVETLRQVMENSEGKLLGVTPWRYVNLADACQMQLAALPPEALKLYRSRVDAVARKWYEEGIARRDRKLLRNVVEQAFAGSWGDKALLALGEMDLEQGHFTDARWCWERILPATPPPGETFAWPGYPDTKLDLAAVRARLVMVSILEGSLTRAREELSHFVRLHGDARGRLGGREVRYATALAELLEQAAGWPSAKPGPDWPTFAGSATRNTVAQDMVDVADVDWRAVLRPPAQPGAESRSAAVADDARAPLIFHPVIHQGRIFVGDQDGILGFRSDDGKPAWGGGGSLIYREPWDAPTPMPVGAEVFGTPRYTLTIADGRLYARMGSPVTNLPQQPGASQLAGSLICLDLRAEGKLLWKNAPEDGWAFEGAPVVDGTSLYVAMRRSDIRPQAHVACFDVPTGRLRWRRFVCAAETPARGTLAECTQSLLTLAGGTIYFNTNLGAVAALSAADGRIAWVSLYPRARGGNLAKLAPHWQRDVNPCVFDHGRLFVAPADSPKVFALDAATGQILWPGYRGAKPSETDTAAPLDDVVHLLGVAGDYLIAGGQRLYWINVGGDRPGSIAFAWPQGPEKLGYGRGLLAGNLVVWPTRDKIYLFDQRTARLKKTFDIAPLGIRGGNLLVSEGRLLIATGNELIALNLAGGKKKDSPPEITFWGLSQFSFLGTVPIFVPRKWDCPLTTRQFSFHENGTVPLPRLLSPATSLAR